MEKDIRLYLPMEGFERLHETLSKARKNASVVRVSKEDLTNLLMDHSRLIQRLRDLGVYTKEPESVS